LNISKIIFYTAYREDKLSNTYNSTNPILFKSTLGTSNQVSALDWEHSTVNVLNDTYEHIKIELDEDGNGTYNL